MLLGLTPSMYILVYFGGCTSNEMLLKSTRLAFNLFVIAYLLELYLVSAFRAINLVFSSCELTRNYAFCTV